MHADNAWVVSVDSFQVTHDSSGIKIKMGYFD